MQCAADKVTTTSEIDSSVNGQSAIGNLCGNDMAQLLVRVAAS